SWKGTRERIHSPKGRASLMREWLKQMSERGVNPVAESAAIKRSNFLLTLPARIKNTWQKRQEIGRASCRDSGETTAVHTAQAEDGIRDFHVTGVQTCALPISSWKGTRERIHSPKGRASLMREWLKQMSERGVNPVAESAAIKRSNFLLTLLARIKNTWQKRQGEYDFSHEVHESMVGCLACKSCAGQCPIKVDVPEFRSKFLELYYSRYLRPLKDYFIGGLEFMIPTLARV